MGEQTTEKPCDHNYITITKSTYFIPVPYRRCSKCGDVQPQQEDQSRG